jgi:hypothetical protein
VPRGTEPTCSDQLRGTAENAANLRDHLTRGQPGQFGALFVLTQYLQFGLGYSALQAGVRVLPAAGAIAVVAPLSTIGVRAAGTKITVAAGLLIVASGRRRVPHRPDRAAVPGLLSRRPGGRRHAWRWTPFR